MGSGDNHHGEILIGQKVPGIVNCNLQSSPSTSDMKLIPEDSPITIDVVTAIKDGNTVQLQQLLAENEDLASSHIICSQGVSRSLLHIATDWPGHFPHVAATIKILVAAGADPNIGICGPKSETPLHWAASSNDVAAIDALLDAEADTDAQGAVIAGGDPLEDAIGFQNWAAARRLVERGANTALGDEAALGLMDRVEARFNAGPVPSSGSSNYAFWIACCAGQVATAQYLLAKGADINWIPDWCAESPLDGAIKSKNDELIQWLQSMGAVRNAKA